MRIFALCSLVAGVELALCVTAPAKGPAWCAEYRNGGTNCGFNTQEQCLAAVSGIGGYCNRNYIDGEPDRPAARREREVEPKPKRKEEKERAAPAEKPAPPPAAAKPAPAPPMAVQPSAAPAQQPANDFQTARALILSGKYEAGIAAMKSLGYDDHPDVAGSIGLASAQLGRFDEARTWYSKALAADPNHVTTLGNSGALYVAQGDLAKARSDLERIKAICGGTTCREYQELEALIAAKRR